MKLQISTHFPLLKKKKNPFSINKTLMKTKIQFFFLYIIMQSFMKIELDVCLLLGFVFVCVCVREREREREREMLASVIG